MPTALSLNALPAATGLVTAAAKATSEAGGKFLRMLGDLAPGGETDETSGTDASLTDSHSFNASDSMDSHTKSWCERFMSWLKEQPGFASQPTGQPISVKLSLDQLDQPNIEIVGDSSGQLAAAVRDQSSFLSEFRELAFDHAQALGRATPQSLHISQSNIAWT